MISLIPRSKQGLSRWVWLGVVGTMMANLAIASPRLFLDETGVKGLRIKLEHPPFAARWQRLLKNADYFLAQRVPNAGANASQWSRGNLGLVGICSLAYLVTGEPRYGERAKREIEWMLAEPTWRVPKDWNKGADLNSAEACLACALFYDWAGDLLTESERAHFQERLLVLGIRPYLESVEKYHDWWVDNTVTNWCGVCHGGSGLAALVLSDVSPEAKRAVELARAHVPKFLDHVIGLDGDGHEGVMYWRYGTEYSLYFTMAAWPNAPGSEMARVFHLLDERMAGYWDISMQASDGRYANFNDMSEDTFAGLYADDPTNFEGGPRAALSALFERAFADPTQKTAADPLLLWAADHGGSQYFFRGTSPFWFLWRRAVPPSGPKPLLPESMLFRTSGHTIWKSVDFWIAFNSGWISDKSHANCDLGSFMLVSRGERFVVDPGYGKARTADHATISFDGRDQSKGAQARYLAWIERKSYRYLVSDLTRCYDDKVKRLHRHLALLGGNILVIIDDAVVTEGTAFEWNLPTRFPIAVNGPDASLEGTKSSLHVISVAPLTKLNVSRRNDLNYLAITPSRPSTETLLVTVLAPAEIGAATPKVSWQEGQSERMLTVENGEGRFSVHLYLADSWQIDQINGEALGRWMVPAERTFTRAQ